MKEIEKYRILGWWPLVPLAAAIFSQIILTLIFGRFTMLKYPWSYPAILGLGMAGTVWYYSRLKRRITAADGRVCTKCRYTLLDLPAPGVCPECGHPFPADAHASVWKELEMVKPAAKREKSTGG